MEKGIGKVLIEIMFTRQGRKDGCLREFLATVDSGSYSPYQTLETHYIRRYTELASRTEGGTTA